MRRATHRRALERAVIALAALLSVMLLTAARPPAPTPAVQVSYMLNCMGCHLSDGSGAPGKVPSMRESLPPLARSPAGRRYLIQVPGASQSALTDRQLAQLLNWMVRTLSEAGAPRGFVDFTAEEVAAYRRTPLIDVRGTRARLLAAASPDRTP
jgi:mono/diheme cytochrome c family protein